MIFVLSFIHFQRFMMKFFTPRKRSLGGYIGFSMSVRLSVRPSVRLSVCPQLILTSLDGFPSKLVYC